MAPESSRRCPYNHPLMRLALIQLNPTVGDIAGNRARIESWLAKARDTGADLAVFPELALTGYPPRDLLIQHGFLESVERAARELAAGVRGITAVIGAPWRSAAPNALPANALLVLCDGAMAHVYAKRLLPTYDVFDEDRYFRAGDAPAVIEVGGVRVGLSICEDLWRGADVGAGIDARYADHADPVDELAHAGAQLIINPSASPFVLGKGAKQRAILQSHAARHRVAVAAVNQVGGNDDLIFDGHAAVYVPHANGAPGAKLIAAGPGFEEAMTTIDLNPASWSALPEARDPLLTAAPEELLYRALVLGVRDYCRKTGFKQIVLGLSGGIDSAVTAAIACAAIGAPNVLGLLLPSRFSSEGSINDADDLAARLAMKSVRIPIEEPHAAMEHLLAPAFGALNLPTTPGVTEENIQSRLRGTILMAFSNKMNALLVTTGNKSEVAVGYCTLYGDMNGGLAVLSDVTKMLVYKLARWMNDHHAAAGFARLPIPENSITKPPSAELRPNQTDQDSLPPYEILDAILERHVERHESPSEIAAATGIDRATIDRVVRLILLAEYKRKQMPVGLKVTSVTFGPGRRWPIVHGWKP